MANFSTVRDFVDMIATKSDSDIKGTISREKMALKNSTSRHGSLRTYDAGLEKKNFPWTTRPSKETTRTTLFNSFFYWTAASVDTCCSPVSSVSSLSSLANQKLFCTFLFVFLASNLLNLFFGPLRSVRSSSWCTFGWTFRTPVAVVEIRFVLW